MTAKGLQIIFVSLIIACSSSRKSTSPHPSVVSDVRSSDGLEIIARNDCLICHKAYEKLIGPSYRDVANKYEISDDNITRLVKKIKMGGSGSWGDLPMSPHPTLSNDDAQQIVKYILSFKNK